MSAGLVTILKKMGSIEVDEVFLHLGGLGKDLVDVTRVSKYLGTAALGVTVVELLLGGLALGLLLLHNLINKYSVLTFHRTLQGTGLGNSHATVQTRLVTDLGIAIGSEYNIHGIDVSAHYCSITIQIFCLALILLHQVITLLAVADLAGKIILSL